MAILFNIKQRVSRDPFGVGETRLLYLLWLPCGYENRAFSCQLYWWASLNVFSLSGIPS